MPQDPTDLVRPLWRALVWFRVLTWAFAVLFVYTRWDGIERHSGAVVLLVIMTVWTVVVSVGYGLLAAPRVEVVIPASPVPLRAHRVAELVAAVREALANVTRHAGPDARAWVVAEDLGDEVLVVVRDDGVGTSAERMEEASRAGRLGVSQSIRGRIADLGGTAAVRTAPGEGVEWELKVSR